MLCTLTYRSSVYAKRCFKSVGKDGLSITVLGILAIHLRKISLYHVYGLYIRSMGCHINVLLIKDMNIKKKIIKNTKYSGNTDESYIKILKFSDQGYHK